METIKMNIQKTARASVLALSVLSLGACSSMTPTQQSVLSGAAIGTAVGAVGTVMTGGCIACGAAVGGVVGAGTGYVVDQIQN
jgi:hypothetical protein